MKAVNKKTSILEEIEVEQAAKIEAVAQILLIVNKFDDWQRQDIIDMVDKVI